MSTAISQRRLQPQSAKEMQCAARRAGQPQNFEQSTQDVRSELCVPTDRAVIANACLRTDGHDLDRPLSGKEIAELFNW